MRYRARAPLRIDFGGGWTDVPLYARETGGAVLNAAISRYVQGSISVPGERGLVRTVHSERSKVSYWLDLPGGAGLGASAAQTVLWVTLVKSTISNVSERAEIAEIAWSVGNLLGILGGKQDEYASALGGVTYYTFGHEVGIERLPLTPSSLDLLLSRLVLVYSGEQHLSGSIHERVWSRFAAGETAVIDALARMTRTASDMKNSLLADDIDSLAELVNENWSNQKVLDPSVTNPLVDDLFTFGLRNGALGGKACGAGGGGCLLFVCRPGERERLVAAFKARRVRIVDFDFDHQGVFFERP